MRNKKGFVLIETMITIVILATALLTIYSLFNNIIVKERRKSYYDDPIFVYRANYIATILDDLFKNSAVGTDGIDLSSLLISGYDNNGNPQYSSLIVFTCNNDAFTYNDVGTGDCNNFFLNNQIYRIYISTFDLSYFDDCALNKNNIQSGPTCMAYRSLSNQTKMYFNSLPYVPGAEGYYIVFEFNDDGKGGICSRDKCMHQFASVRYGANNYIINYNE